VIGGVPAPVSGGVVDTAAVSFLAAASKSFSGETISGGFSLEISGLGSAGFSVGVVLVSTAGGSEAIATLRSTSGIQYV